jgi:uncharacterized protein CbrC (UPF0167 family)
MYHCGDGCAFLGAVGGAELGAHPDALEMLRREHDGMGWEQDVVNDYIDDLNTAGSRTAYLFSCDSASCSNRPTPEGGQGVTAKTT